MNYFAGMEKFLVDDRCQSHEETHVDLGEILGGYASGRKRIGADKIRLNNIISSKGIKDSQPARYQSSVVNGSGSAVNTVLVLQQVGRWSLSDPYLITTRHPFKSI